MLGEYTPKDCEPVPNYFPQIVSQAEFDAAREQADRKRKNGKTCYGNRTNDRADNLFTDLLLLASPLSALVLAEEPRSLWQAFLEPYVLGHRGL